MHVLLRDWSLLVILSHPNLSLPLFPTLVSFCDSITGQVPPCKSIHMALTCSVFTAWWDTVAMFPGVAAINKSRWHAFPASQRSPQWDGMCRSYIDYVIWRITWVPNKVALTFIRVKLNYSEVGVSPKVLLVVGYSQSSPLLENFHAYTVGRSAGCKSIIGQSLTSRAHVLSEDSKLALGNQQEGRKAEILWVKIVFSMHNHLYF